MVTNGNIVGNISFKTFLSTVEQAEGMEKGERTRTANVERNKLERGLLRRTLKVKPNVDMAKKKVLTKGRAKYVNSYEVLRGLEEGDEKLCFLNILFILKCV